MTTDTSAAAELEPARPTLYDDVIERILLLLEDEHDWIAAMATVASELHHSFDYFDWTGFYRNAGNRTLVIGPYQGGHGCLRISFDRGVCGAAARELRTQLVPDVDAFPGHIACSTSTRSEIVVPVLGADGNLLAVLDVDSDSPDAFDDTDRLGLEKLCSLLGSRYGESPDVTQDKTEA
ncbi:MAG: GAF domain-containing protein [Rhodothermales bacterium]|nr:GAF domain-containing protein [Rhodothermales bacterium]